MVSQKWKYIPEACHALGHSKNNKPSIQRGKYTPNLQAETVVRIWFLFWRNYILFDSFYLFF